MINSVKEWGSLRETDMVHIDLDQVRTQLKLWQADTGFPKSESTCAQTQVEAGFICELAADRCATEGKNFIFDGTFRNAKFNRDFMNRLKDRARQHGNGLRMCVLLVDTELEICKARVEARKILTGRPVPLKFVEECNRESKLTAKKIGADPVLIDTFISIDNNGKYPEFMDVDGCTDREGLLNFLICDDPDSGRKELFKGMTFGGGDSMKSA